MAAVADMNMITPRPSLSVDRDQGERSVVANVTMGANAAVLNGGTGSVLVNGRGSASHKTSESESLARSLSASAFALGPSGSAITLGTSNSSSTTGSASTSTSGSTTTTATVSPSNMPGTVSASGSIPSLTDTASTAVANASLASSQALTSVPTSSSLAELEGKSLDQLRVLRDMYAKAKEGAESFLKATPNLPVRVKVKVSGPCLPFHRLGPLIPITRSYAFYVLADGRFRIQFTGIHR